jgi:hypothetical protein
VQNQEQVAARLEISVTALWSLSSNSSFPRPSNSDERATSFGTMATWPPSQYYQPALTDLLFDDFP